MNCKFYSEEIGKCLFDGPPDDCPFDNKETYNCFEPIKENKKESKNMKKCKFYAETARRGWCSNVDCLLEKCYFDDNLNSCELFEPTKCEKESSPYRLNNTEVNVFSKSFKDYIKDENKLEKLVENFRSYLSNASKSPANAEGKCSDEDTLYRIMKERIEDEKEQKNIWSVKNGDTGLTHTTCERLIFVDHEIGKTMELSPDKLSEFDWININGIKFNREK